MRTAHKFAMENPKIRADMVEVTEFPNIATKYSVMSVPKTIINETVQFVGVVPESKFLEYVLEATRG